MAKKAFISYSHSDHEFAQRLAKSLNDRGVEVWYDKWDIGPGDSVVRKIFEEGLAEAELFLVVLSNASINSAWVKDELDVATIRRIEKITRLIPLLKEECEIPVALKPLHWIDMRSDFESGVKRIVDVYFGVSDRPPLGAPPNYVSKLNRGIPGLTPRAATVASFLALEGKGSPADRAYSGDAIANATKLSAADVNDAIDELKEQGLVETIDWLGTAPYQFGQAEPTYALFLRMKDFLDHDPEVDIITVVNAIAALGKTNGGGLAKATGLPVERLNRAMQYVQDYGLAQVINVLGTAPYSFGYVHASRRTRDFASDHGR